MAEFDNDSAGRFQQWWAGNGRAITIGLIVGALLVIAWQGYRWYQAHQVGVAAEIYQPVGEALSAGTLDADAMQAVERLKSDYADTPYAAEAALRLAGYHVDNEEYAAAREQLEWTMENAENEGVAHIARLRAARLAWTLGDPAAGLAMLDTSHPPAFDPLYDETRGDLHVALGDRAAAYSAYQRALDTLPQGTPRSALQSKRDDTAPAEAGGSGEMTNPAASES